MTIGAIHVAVTVVTSRLETFNHHKTVSRSPHFASRLVMMHSGRPAGAKSINKAKDTGLCAGVTKTACNCCLVPDAAVHVGHE